MASRTGSIPHQLVAVPLALTLAAVSGCDIVQGFRSAGDAIFPPEQTYLDVPGFALATGGYRNLEFAAGSELYLLARTADPQDASLYAMRYADPKPCVLANVGRHQVGRGVYQGPAIIGYFEPGDATSTLHFADAGCHLYDMTLPNANLPMDEEPTGFAALTSGDLVLVDPVVGSNRMLVPAVQAIAGGVLPNINATQSGQQLDMFTYDWTEVGRFGDGVVGFGSAGQGFFLRTRREFIA